MLQMCCQVNPTKDNKLCIQVGLSLLHQVVWPVGIDRRQWLQQNIYTQHIFVSPQYFLFCWDRGPEKTINHIFLQSAWLFVHFHAEKIFGGHQLLKIPSNLAFLFNGLLTFEGKPAKTCLFCKEITQKEMGSGVLKKVHIALWGWQNEVFIPFVFLLPGTCRPFKIPFWVVCL